MNNENKVYLPFLMIPAIAILPAVLFRIMGHAPGPALQYVAAGIAIGLATGVSALGRRLPILSSVPFRQRVVGGAALGITGLAAIAGVFLGLETAGFAALGATAVLLLDSPAYSTQSRTWIVAGALVYGAALAAVLAPVSNAEFGGYLWKAGAAGWLSVLGAIIVAGLIAGSKASVRLPLVAAAAAAFSLMSGGYFNRIEGAELPAYTYAVGIAVNILLVGIGYAASVFDHRSALVWGGLGSVVYAVLGPAGYTAYGLVSLVSGIAALLKRGREPRPAWNMLRVLLELSPGVLLLLGFFLFPAFQLLLWMGMAAFAGVAAVEAGAAVGTRWAKSARTVIPWRRVAPGTLGGISGMGIIAAAAAAGLAALLPALLGLSGYGLGWAIVAAASGLAGALLRSIMCGTGIVRKGALTRVSAPFLSAAIALLLTLIQYKLFPGS